MIDMELIITCMVLGLIFVVSEIFILPGIGVAGVLGILALGGASYLAFTDFGNVEGMIVTSIDLVLLAILMCIFFRKKTWQKVTLETNIESKAVVSEVELVKVGEQGKAITRLAPSGTVRFGYEKVEARAFEGMIDSGADVEVVLIDDNRIYVKQI
jgi:membrane-bound ClpP family serine protease